MKFPPWMLATVVPLAAAGRYENPICAANNLIVKAPSGTYRGIINGTTPLVRAFLGIPYAEPPTEELRWAPPQKLDSKFKTVYDATRYPPSCPQDRNIVPQAFKEVNPAYIVGGPLSEDCLALSVWAPAESGGKRLPVIMFMTGGAFTTGGVEINYQLPHHWVQRTQSHIAVTINYRLNIFGFPSAAGLESQNLGILDQRMALEWVRDNIEAFGGDPDRITLWGQSAGAAATDYHNFAFWEDPIANGFFSQSGSAYLGIGSADKTNSNFTYVAKQVGCDFPSNGTAELECMRKVPFQDISAAVERSFGLISFYPLPDEKVVFSNYTDRYAQGKISDRPAIFSTTENEGTIVVPFNRSGINEAAATQVTQSLFLCPASRTMKSRSEAGLKTYRSIYSGDFPNVSPLEWLNAYHCSDLPMLFGTHWEYDNGQGESSDFEYETSEKMQDLLLAFMEDPHSGPGKLGWEDVGSGKMLQFGVEGSAVSEVSIESIDGVCP